MRTISDHVCPISSQAKDTTGEEDDDWGFEDDDDKEGKSRDWLVVSS